MTDADTADADGDADRVRRPVDPNVARYRDEFYAGTPLGDKKRGRLGLARKKLHATIADVAGLEEADKLAHPSKYVDADDDGPPTSVSRETTDFERLANRMVDEHLDGEYDDHLTSRW